MSPAWLLAIIAAPIAAGIVAPDPARAYYIAQALLVCVLLVLLARRKGWWRVVCGVGIVCESMTAACGAWFDVLTVPGYSMCDSGTGLPTTWIVLSGILLVAGALLRRGDDH